MSEPAGDPTLPDSEVPDPHHPQGPDRTEPAATSGVDQDHPASDTMRKTGSEGTPAASSDGDR